ncbi:MAG: DNA-formamidopyrimidine glycosylase family protein [Nocardioidaceae bacterium]
MSPSTTDTLANVPEGDTVWRTARRLNEVLANQVLVTSDFRVPAYSTADLTGSRVREAVARGKHLLVRTEPGLTIHTHLKMDGSWHVYRAGTRWRGPGFQVRLVLGTAEWVCVGFRLGLVEILRTATEESALGHLGPDLLGPDWDLNEALRRLNRDPDRPVGEALLDQRNLAGIGNLYQSEACFLAGVDPRTPVTSVPALDRLVERARHLLDSNKDRARQSTTGDLRRGQNTWVYQRGGQPCRRCNSVITSQPLGEPGRERLTFWCQHCQPA